MFEKRDYVRGKSIWLCITTGERAGSVKEQSKNDGLK